MLLAISMAALFLVPSSAESSSSSFSSSVEAKAMLNSGWWGNFSSTNHCDLAGITCNGAGIVIRMRGYKYGYNLADMNWSSLPNLEYLDLSHSGLKGGIPGEIGTLSKLTHLDLSVNNKLQGVLPPTLGNLAELVYLDLSATNIEACEIGWTQRVNVVQGMAHALSYLHHDCTPPIVHRDISSNNILLNSEEEAFVADFGIARLLNPDSSNQTVIAGTYGYIAPGQKSVCIKFGLKLEVLQEMVVHWSNT
ncbi:hypothetical protein C3L33_22787, partial [Rhododendron williamsianum]